MDLENKLRLAICMCDNYSHTNLEAVKRNIDRFPEEFCFKLTENEFETLRFQIGTSKQINKSISYTFY